ncbi:MAG: tRNA 2-thiouridine(34) synthase MnmA [Pedosphaera sp.]|nr:tRNA 2-thiouridine(34) synthase MnmA [Pedosphaera sp.]
MKIAVLLSGGVDSSVALHLVKKEGHKDITAFYLKIWLEDELSYLGSCPWEEDLQYARAVCDTAGVPLEIVSMQTEYQERIVACSLDELRQGRTPSPDILCNQRIKFGLFFERIDPSFDKIVTGHYAQIEETGGVISDLKRVPQPSDLSLVLGDDKSKAPTFLLKRSPDPVKDQTYFLSALDQRQLRRLWFPIGHLTKPEVRKLAHELDLPNRERKDSQGICFLGKIKYPEFIRYHLGEKMGEIIEIETGRKLAEHRGYWFHTVGQRKGLGLGGGPWYVVKKDVEANRVYVAHSNHYLDHAKKQFTVNPVHWIAGEPAETNLQTKVRHSPHLEECQIRCLGEQRWEVTLAEKDQGIASGQSAIFYNAEICLGGGVIE